MSSPQGTTDTDTDTDTNVDTGSSIKTELLESLQLILENQSHLFACGGSIPVRGHGTPVSPLPSEQREQYPITIRWDVDGAGDDQVAPASRLSLPLVPGSETNLKRLIQHCQPATFGRGGQDVYDETYRQALKMDTTAFCTTFDPYSAGIIDTVAQILLPSVYDSVTHRGVRAELYKLNVYSGPSGRFKSHVDTPRSREQFGSLVVCLPLEHEGGQLKVRHKGEETTFDWSTTHNSPNHAAIHWAAFYSDCEHEVLEVSSGHRITLTYNLYAIRGSGRLTSRYPSMDPAHVPLFESIKRTISQDPFCGQGGTLGFWCSHAYAYNHKTESPLPDALKGVDAVLWETFQSLDLNPKIAPVIQMSEDTRELFEWYYYENPGPSSSLKSISESMPSTFPSEWIIGHKFGVDRSSLVEEMEDYHFLYKSWGSYSRGPIYWLAKPGTAEMQLLYIAHGNEPTLEIEYSHCAILVTIPAKE